MFASTIAWCALAGNIWSLIIARAFCGFGAGGVLAIGPIMTNDLVPTSVRGTYQAYINISVGVGAACGAAVGGVMSQSLGWRWSFGVQVPAILIILAFAFYTTPPSLGPQLAKGSQQGIWRLMDEFDLAGSFFLTLSVTFLLLALNLGGNFVPWGHPTIIASFIASCLAALVLIYTERRAEYPIMPLKMILSAPRANLVWSNFFVYLGYSAIQFNAPIFLQAVKLESSSTSGLVLAFPKLLETVCGASSGFLITRTGRLKSLVVIGVLFMLFGSMCVSSMSQHIPTFTATVYLALASIGIGLNTPATSVAVLLTSEYEDQAVMTTTLNIWRRLGAVMGVSISSFLLQNALNLYLNQFVEGPNKIEVCPPQLSPGRL